MGIYFEIRKKKKKKQKKKKKKKKAHMVEITMMMTDKRIYTSLQLSKT